MITSQKQAVGVILALKERRTHPVRNTDNHVSLTIEECRRYMIKPEEANKRPYGPKGRCKTTGVKSYTQASQAYPVDRHCNVVLRVRQRYESKFD